MTIAVYEAHFHSLSRNSATCISIKSELIKKFMNGLDGTYKLDITQMAVSWASS